MKIKDINENLRAWFGKGKQGGAGGGGWDRYNTKGERIGKCGEKKPGEGKPKCLSKQKANQLRAKGGKKAIAAAVNKKRREDPNPDRKGGAKMVSNNIKKESLQYYVENRECPHCHGPMFGENQLTEAAKKDACYHKVKSRYKVWPSAYASGALVKCRKAGASNWGNKSKTTEEVKLAEDEQLAKQFVGEDSAETLRKQHHFIYEVAAWKEQERKAQQDREASYRAAKEQERKAQQDREASYRAAKEREGSGKKQQSADDFVAPHGDAKQELELFAAGRKPAAIVNEPQIGLWKRLIDSGRYVLRPLTGEGGRQSGFVIGQPGEDDRVSKIQTLVQNATDAGLKGDFRAYQNSNYHRWLGRLLGYPAEAIERFITNYFRDTEDLAKQRVDEQATSPSSRRTPRVGDTIEWSTMRDRTPQRGHVIEVRGLSVIVNPENSRQSIKLFLGNKSLSFRVIPNPVLDTPLPPPPKLATTPNWSNEFKNIRNAEGESRKEFGDKILAAGGELKFISRGPFGPDSYVLNGKEVRWQGVKK